MPGNRHGPSTTRRPQEIAPIEATPPAPETICETRPTSSRMLSLRVWKAGRPGAWPIGGQGLNVFYSGFTGRCPEGPREPIWIFQLRR